MFRVFDERQLAHAPALEMHNGGWTAHNETPARAELLRGRLGLLAAARDFGLEPLARVHTAEYLEFLQHAHDRWLKAGREGGCGGLYLARQAAPRPEAGPD